MWHTPMSFSAKLIELRKKQGFTQQSFSETVGLHVNQIKKYEAGTAQPTLKALVKVAKALHVSLDQLVFDDGERGPDEGLRLQFEAVSKMSDEEKTIIKALLDGMIVKHQTQQIMSGISS